MRHFRVDDAYDSSSCKRKYQTIMVKSFLGVFSFRGGSIAMLLVLQPEGLEDESEEYVILTLQPQIPAGSLAFLELPAGVLDDSGTFTGAAAKEKILGSRFRTKDLRDMTKLANEQGATDTQENLQDAVHPSPGGSDEFVPILMSQKRMSRDKIDGLRGRLTGLRDHGEKIALRLCRLVELLKVGARDGKTLAAVALYEGLRESGTV